MISKPACLARMAALRYQRRIFGNIGLIHGSRLNRIQPVANDMRRRKRDHPAEAIGGVQAVVNQLDFSQAGHGA